MSRRASLDDLENETCLMAPKIENRIVILTPEKRRELSLERQLEESDTFAHIKVKRLLKQHELYLALNLIGTLILDNRFLNKITFQISNVIFYRFVLETAPFLQMTINTFNVSF
uniref:Uncharacterized protein n=1 Tax=Cacopsylla melanoneura TaxID=428564 RepID=A0A8D8THU2_9HEMI